jgi:hypothetical protein
LRKLRRELLSSFFLFSMIAILRFSDEIVLLKSYSKEF